MFKILIGVQSDIRLTEVTSFLRGNLSGFENFFEISPLVLKDCINVLFSKLL